MTLCSKFSSQGAMETPLSSRKDANSADRSNAENYNRTQELIKLDGKISRDFGLKIVNKPDTQDLANKYNNYSGDGKHSDDQGLNARFLDKSSDYKK
jgi:hypothetical protein